MSDDEACRAVYREMYRAMIAKDAAALEGVLDERFVLVHMTGMRQGRAAFLSALADGTLNYYACMDDAIDVRVRGGAATLVGKSRVEAAVFGGGRRTWRLEQDMTLEKRNGAWRIVRSEATTY